jgi:RNA polymerase sigma-70 factor (ECF subfamily)
VQSALVKVLERWGEGTALPPASYLWKMAYTTTIDEIRRRRRTREVPLDPEDDGTGPAAEATAASDPEREGSAAEIGAAIGECLQKMVEPRRLAVVLHLQGHTVPEAGRILGWGEKRVENLVYRGLADLRRCLEARGFRP